MNKAVELLQKLPTINIVSKNKSKRFKNISTPCQNIFVKYGNIYDNNDVYALKKYSKNGNNIAQTIVPITNSQTIKSYMNALDNDGESLCNNSITKGYLMEEYDYSDIAIMITADNPKSTRSKHKRVNFLCGYIFLEKKINKKKKNNKELYVSLVCSNKSIGSQLMNIVEHIALIEKQNIITLSAVTDAVPFYIYKGYEPKKGNDVFLSSTGVPIMKRDGTVFNSFKKFGVVEENDGTLVPSTTTTLGITHLMNSKRGHRSKLKRKGLSTKTHKKTGYQGVKVKRNSNSNGDYYLEMERFLRSNSPTNLSNQSVFIPNDIQQMKQSNVFSNSELLKRGKKSYRKRVISI